MEEEQQFFTLLRRVAEEGLTWWRENRLAKDRLSLHRVVKTELDRYIVGDNELRELLSRNVLQEVRLFPLHTSHTGSLFFLRPLWNRDRAGAFKPNLQLWIAKPGVDVIMGYRFEFPDRPDGAHVYPHMQLTREFDLDCGLPKCANRVLTVTYPAVPLPVANCVDMLLTVYVAIRGYKDHSEERLRVILRADRAVREAVMERLPRVTMSG